MKLIYFIPLDYSLNMELKFLFLFNLRCLLKKENQTIFHDSAFLFDSKAYDRQSGLVSSSGTVLLSCHKVIMCIPRLGIKNLNKATTTNHA